MYVFRLQIFCGRSTLINCSAFSFVLFTSDVKYYRISAQSSRYFSWLVFHDFPPSDYSDEVMMSPNVFLREERGGKSQRNEEMRCYELCARRRVEPRLRLLPQLRFTTHSSLIRVGSCFRSHRSPDQQALCGCFVPQREEIQEDLAFGFSLREYSNRRFRLNRSVTFV